MLIKHRKGKHVKNIIVTREKGYVGTMNKRNILELVNKVKVIVKKGLCELSSEQ